MKVGLEQTYWVEHDGKMIPFRATEIVGDRLFGYAVINSLRVSFATTEDRLLPTDAKPEVGAVYRNLKTGNLYIVTRITRDSETLCSRVVYARYCDSDLTEWDRPLALFLDKFMLEEGK